MTNSPAALMLILILHLCRITAQALLPPPSPSLAALVSHIGHLKANALQALLHDSATLFHGIV